MRSKDGIPGCTAAISPIGRRTQRAKLTVDLTAFAALHEFESGPSVWTGRALQAESDDLEKVGLALLYPAY